MEGLLNFSLAFVLVAFAVLVLLGKADGMMEKNKLRFKDGRLRFTVYRRYDAKCARPYFAALLFLIAVFLVLEYVLRPIPEWSVLILFAILLPLMVIMELRCRKRD